MKAQSVFITKIVSVFLIIFLTACQGRYASLGNTMSACGFKTAPYSEFHHCMNEKIPPPTTDGTDYYSKTNGEIRAQLDFYAERIKKKKMKQKDAYEDFVLFVNQKVIEEQESAQTAGTIVAIALVGVAVGACANNDGCLSGGRGNNYYSSTPYMCSSCPSCSPVCTIGKACGNTCITVSDTCHVGRGSACNTQFRSYP
jgi:hypothetical protein